MQEAFESPYMLKTRNFFGMLTGSFSDNKTAPKPGIVPVNGLKISLAVPCKRKFLTYT